MRSKRGVETTHLIVGLVIALIIALLLLAAITGRFSAVKKFAACPGQGGECAANCPPDKAPDKVATVFTSDCKDATPKCCIPAGG